jgi:DNA-binding response OmpR family regulator
MKRRILLVDDEVAVLLTLKAVLEISGFDVDTAASAREGKSKLRTREYDMVITDMRMESECSGEEVIAAARAATYRPAIALLTAFPVNDENWQDGGADKLLVKPMQTRVLLQQIEQLFASHEAKRLAGATAPAAVKPSAAKTLSNGAATRVKRAAVKNAVTKKLSAKTSTRRPVAKATAPVKAAKKSAKVAAKKSSAKP